MKIFPKIHIFFILAVLVGFIAVAGCMDIKKDSSESSIDLVFVRQGNIYGADLSGKNVLQLTKSGKDSFPALSPDGKMVAFQSERDMTEDDIIGFEHIYLIHSDGTGLRKLTGGLTVRGEFPSFSPDGKKILFIALRFPKQDEDDMTVANMSVATMDLKGGSYSFFVGTSNHYIDFGYMYAYPRFSPDGNLIVYSDYFSDVFGGFHVVDTKEKKEIFSSPENSEFFPLHKPFFSPVKNSLLCYRPDYGGPGGDLVLQYSLSPKGLEIEDSDKVEIVVEGKYFTFADNGRYLIYEKAANETEDLSTPSLWRLPWPIESGDKPKLLVKNAAQPSAR